MPLVETTKMDLHKEAWQCSWQNRMSDKLKTVAELFSFMKCFVSCQFLRGLWMDLSGEVSKSHTRTDAKNLVTTARTIHLPEQKETIHMISTLRKEACSGSIYDLCSHSNSELFGRLFNEGISKGRQFDHGCEDKEIAGC